MVLSAFFSALKQFLFPVVAETRGLPVFFWFLFFFQMWLANWLDIIAEQTMHEYKVKPWQILVQGVHKVTATAQGHFTGSMAINWTSSSLFLDTSATFYVITCFRVGFLLLGRGVGVHVVFLAFLSECDPEDPRWKWCVNHEERQKVLELAGELSACSSVAGLPKLLFLVSLTCPLL